MMIEAVQINFGPSEEGRAEGEGGSLPARASSALLFSSSR